MSSGLFLFLQHCLQSLQTVRLVCGLVPADAVDARKTHCDAGFVTGRALQAFKGHFQNK